MALPLAPLLPVALKYGGVALAALWLARHTMPARIMPARIDQRAEDAMDSLPEGLATSRAPAREQVNATGRFRRLITLAGTGRGIELDAAVMVRLRARRVPGGVPGRGSC